jgi:hypothetical protein
MHETANESLLYVRNFWEPEAGDVVITPEGEEKKIQFFFSGSECTQVRLESESRVRFIQDLEWQASPAGLDKILEKMGCKLYADSVSYGGILFGKPQTLEKYAEILRTIRVSLSQLQTKSESDGSSGN